jgi:hypothetical protein
MRIKLLSPIMDHTLRGARREAGDVVVDHECEADWLARGLAVACEPVASPKPAPVVALDAPPVIEAAALPHRRGRRG